MEIAYHASHEQFSPSMLLKYVVMAEQAGFDAIHSSDHFHPWSERQGQSGFSFSWIAAAMQATTLPFSMVCAPGQRYHPAIAAQAMATLAEMFPGRVSFELGSGEALNENITGDEWPSKEYRNQRLLECTTIIRKLLNGEEVSFNGTVKVKQAKLYSLPPVQPLLFCAAISEKTSEWADGLLTTAGSWNETFQKIKAFRNNGGIGKKIYIQFSFSYARSEEEAGTSAYDQWRTNILSPEKLASLSTPKQFDKAAESITINDIRKSICIFSDISRLKEEIDKLATLDANRLILHNVSQYQEEFINDYKRIVTG